MGNSIIQSHTVFTRGLDSTIYALRSRSIENTLPPSDIPSFGNAHHTFDLFWYNHKGYANGAYSWDGARQVGNDWLFQQVVPGSNGILYAVEGDGDLLWYDHLGIAHGTSRWAGPRDIGDGWYIPSLNPSPRDFLGIFCDTRNETSPILSSSLSSIIYAVRLDGTLDWYRQMAVCQNL
jgi:hypothetical protein